MAAVLPAQMAGHTGLLVGGHGEVGQVVGRTLRGPGPDQASPVLVQHCLEWCPLLNCEETPASQFTHTGGVLLTQKSGYQYGETS